jgi:superfamily II DNA/RNA helicase
LSERETFVSFKNFELHPFILKSIEHCGYTTPTPIQAEAIPKVLEGVDLIASANTGTGKTAAFVLPVLNSITKRRFNRKQYGQPSTLILTPTRELATQVSQAINKYGKKLRFTSISLVGGMPYGPQIKNLSRPVDIVVATPGRLIDHLERDRINLSSIEMLVLDEADRMLDMGFVTEVNKIADATPKDRQTLLFTATWDKKMAQLAQRLLNEPERVQVETEVTQDNIDQRLHVADDVGHKTRLLHHILDDEDLKQAIIFSSTKQGADDLAHSLRTQGYAAAALHGDMKQGARNRALTNMRRGKVRLLVATDVAARGIDVSGISHVINFDLPRFAEDYVHRIGRTGRAGAEGTAISFALPDDMRHLERIERYTGQSVPRYIIPGLEPTRKLQQKNRNKKRKYRGNNSGVARKKNYSSSRKPNNYQHSRRR